MEVKQRYADKLITCRKDKGFSQEEVAAEIGVNQTTISKHENGFALPTPSNMMKLASLYDVSVSYLFFE